MMRGERGAASVLLVATAAAVVLGVGTMLGAAGILVTSARLQAAADNAAIAAAAALAGRAAGQPCARADEIARLHRARVADCRTRLDRVRVEIRAPTGLFAVGPFAVGAVAVAGQQGQSAIYGYDRDH